MICHQPVHVTAFPRALRALFFASGLLASFFAAGCSKEKPTTEPKGLSASQSPAPSTPKPVPSHFSGPWQTESAYAVSRVTTELAHLYAYAAVSEKAIQWPSIQVTATSIQTGPHAVVRVEVDFGNGAYAKQDLSLDAGVFAISTYRELAGNFKRLLGVSLNAETAAPEGPFVAELLENSTETLLKLDRDTSSALGQHFLSPTQHHRAALLIGVFSLRDCSDRFLNLLPEFARMTAHRVFADSLQQDSAENPTAILAAALEAVLQGNQAEALKLTERLPAEFPYNAWSRIVKMRATRDYRIFSGATDAPLAERTAWFLALSDAVSSDVANTSYSVPEALAQLPDWWRILNANQPSVSVGHQIAEHAVRAEWAEIEKAYTATRRPLTESRNTIINALNDGDSETVHANSEGKPVIEVLGWNLWAQLLQRQLCFALASDFNFLENRYGSRKDSRSYRSGIDEVFNALKLYPFVRRLNATDEEYYKSAQDACMKVVRAHPEIVPAGVWNEICYNVPFCKLYIPPPHAFINEWHCDNPLPGTVYDIPARRNHPSMVHRNDWPAVLKSLMAAAPYDNYLIDYSLKGRKTTAAELAQAYSTLSDFYPGIQMVIADKFSEEKDFVSQERYLRAASSRLPTALRTLAEFYREHHRDDLAATAYQQWMKNESDPIAVANHSKWLVTYFESHNQPKEAYGLADQAARSYSFRGLATLGWLLEQRRDFRRAKVYYERIQERYGSSGPLIGFLLRNEKQLNGAVPPDLLPSLLKRQFPNGLVKSDPTRATAPHYGVEVDVTNEAITRAGLKKGDIVFNLRGYTVQDWDSYIAIRDFETFEPYVIAVWREGAAVVLPAISAEYRFRRDLKNYRAR